jgi:hypothetical protein
MKLLYYRVYYTIYRGLLWLGQSHETDSVRFNVVFIQSLFTMLITVGLNAFLVGITRKPFIINSKWQSIVVLLCLFEASLSPNWGKDRSKNILLTLAFMVFSIALLCVSLMYLKAHSLKK